DRERAEHERAQFIQEQAARISQAKDQFLAVVSHELRTPLTAILGWAEIIRSGALDPAQTSSALESIARNARLQEELIRDILDVTKISTGQLSMEMASMNLRHIIEETMKGFYLLAERKFVQLKVDLHDTPEFVGDPKRFHQIVWNLVGNALKFTPP